jgi:DNA replication and repair protein RecF
LGAFELLKSEGSEPILILDDVFAELDTYRRQQLIEATGTAEQTIITAAVEGDLPFGLETERRYVLPGRVVEGKIS